jgi:hypothetical protein
MGTRHTGREQHEEKEAKIGMAHAKTKAAKGHQQTPDTRRGKGDFSWSVTLLTPRFWTLTSRTVREQSCVV